MPASSRGVSWVSRPRGASGAGRSRSGRCRRLRRPAESIPSPVTRARREKQATRRVAAAAAPRTTPCRRQPGGSRAGARATARSRRTPPLRQRPCSLRLGGSCGARRAGRRAGAGVERRAGCRRGGRPAVRRRRPPACRSAAARRERTSATVAVRPLLITRTLGPPPGGASVAVHDEPRRAGRPAAPRMAVLRVHGGRAVPDRRARHGARCGRGRRAVRGGSAGRRLLRGRRRHGRGDGQRRPLGELGQTFFGEMALIDGGDRSATVRAKTPMSLLVLGRHDFNEMLSTRCRTSRRS